MKTIENGNNNAQWNNGLIRDLSFIKKNLRYRFSKKLLYGSAGLGFLLVFLARMGYTLWLMDKAKVWNNPIMWGLMIAVAIVILFPLIGYIQIVRFKAVPTPFFFTENQEVIQQFLKSLHLVIYRHPEAPEVFQIMSKNLSVNEKKDQREIMVFIADDKRILVNSHYSVGGFNLQPPSGNYKRMAKQLAKFVQTYSINANGSIVPING